MGALIALIVIWCEAGSIWWCNGSMIQVWKTYHIDLWFAHGLASVYVLTWTWRIKHKAFYGSVIRYFIAMFLSGFTLFYLVACLSIYKSGWCFYWCGINNDEQKTGHVNKPRGHSKLGTLPLSLISYQQMEVKFGTDLSVSFIFTLSSLSSTK